jgi:hypothetical protein
MQTIESIVDAVDRIRAFERERWANLPAHTQAELDRLGTVGVSPVDRIVKTAEALYAERSKALTRNADRLLVASLFQFAAMNGWHGLNDDSRAQRAEAALRRDAGDAAFTQSPDDDPETKPEFLEPAPEEAPIEPDA